MADSPLRPHSSSAAELKNRLDAEREGDAHLLYRDGAGRQRIVLLGPLGDRLTIGRTAAADICLEGDSEVSRVHAELERVGDEWAIVDDGLSRNGSYVNGERIAGRRRLEDGDKLRFGGTVIVHRNPSYAEQSGTAVPGDFVTAADLSDTQRRVLTALCRPYKDAAYPLPATNAQVAAEVFLSVDAVKTHLRACFQKFGVEDLPQNQKRTRLVELAFQSGLVNERDL